MAQRRREILASGEIYHTYNRSVGNEDILIGKRELERALGLIDYYRFPQRIKYSEFIRLPIKLRKEYNKEFKKKKPLVEIYAYALMSDHYHLLLKQLQDEGIKVYLSIFQNSFAKYFNIKHDRNGGLFQSPFKAKRIVKDEILLHVSRYIHLNPVTSYVIDYQQLNTYPWTSYLHYLEKRDNDLINTDFITNISGSRKRYEDFVMNQVDYQRKLRQIRKFLLE